MDQHDAVKSLLAGFVAGSLQAEENKRIRRHLDLCEGCSRDFAVLRRLAQAVQSLTEEVPGPECLVRITALARARRMEVLEHRRQAGLAAAAALFGWAMVIMALPLWQGLSGMLRGWSGWPISTGPLTAVALGALFSYLFLPGLWALLERYRVTNEEEGRR
jgi:anti-sigma factor RsiW